MPKIFYIGSFNKIWDEQGPALALEALGCQVKRFQEANFRFSIFRDAVFAEKPDVVIWAKLKIDPRVQSILVQFLAEQGVKTVCFMPDLYWGLGREFKARQRTPMFRADLVLSPDGGHEAQWLEAHINHKVLRQGIPDQYAYLAEYDKDYDWDVVFIGGVNPEYRYRLYLVKELRQKYGDQFKWIGRLDSDEIRGHELNKLYASSKVIIGESVYSPHYWSNRIYETIGRGGFIIHPVVEGLKDEFEPYKHFIPYSHDFVALHEIIAYYLKHKAERDKIRLAGFEHCKQNFTLQSRCKTLLQLIA